MEGAVDTVGTQLTLGCVDGPPLGACDGSSLGPDDGTNDG